MRMSRRAVIHATPLNWHKYDYKLKQQQKAVSYKLTEWEFVSRQDSGCWAEGNTGWAVYKRNNSGIETYELTYTGTFECIDSSNPGIVYLIAGNRIQKHTVNSDGSGEVYFAYMEATYTKLENEWLVLDYVGLVRAKKGTLPDAGRGYTYEKTDGEYTIMTDGENYYAYKLWGVSE